MRDLAEDFKGRLCPLVLREFDPVGHANAIREARRESKHDHVAEESEDVDFEVLNPSESQACSLRRHECR